MDAALGNLQFVHQEKMTSIKQTTSKQNPCEPSFKKIRFTWREEKKTKSQQSLFPRLKTRFFVVSIFLIRCMWHTAYAECLQPFSHLTSFVPHPQNGLVGASCCWLGPSLTNKTMTGTILFPSKELKYETSGPGSAQRCPLHNLSQSVASPPSLSSSLSFKVPASPSLVNDCNFPATQDHIVVALALDRAGMGAAFHTDDDKLPVPQQTIFIISRPE